MMTLEKKAPPAKRGKNGAKAAANPTFTQFVNVRLAPEFEEMAADYSTNLDILTDGLITLTESGYKVTLSYDFQRGNHICTLTCRNEESANNGKTMSSFGASMQDSIAAALVKHYHQTEAVWTADDEGQKRRFG